MLTGVSQLEYLTGDEILKRATSGQVREFAPVVGRSTPSWSSRSGRRCSWPAARPAPTLAVIRSAGVPVVANTEWLEPTALARAEWLKYMALFLNEERSGAERSTAR